MKYRDHVHLVPPVSPTRNLLFCAATVNAILKSMVFIIDILDSIIQIQQYKLSKKKCNMKLSDTVKYDRNRSTKCQMEHLLCFFFMI